MDVSVSHDTPHPALSPRGEGKEETPSPFLRHPGGSQGQSGRSRPGEYLDTGFRRYDGGKEAALSPLLPSSLFQYPNYIHSTTRSYRRQRMRSVAASVSGGCGWRNASRNRDMWMPCEVRRPEIVHRYIGGPALSRAPHPSYQFKVGLPGARSVKRVLKRCHCACGWYAAGASPAARSSPHLPLLFLTRENNHTRPLRIHKS